MNHEHWSANEKKIARRAYDASLERELAAVLMTLKERAAAAATPDDVWSIEHYLAGKHRDIDSKYDFRSSQLVMVFGRLMREGWLLEEDLVGISDEKLSLIRSIATG